MCEYCQEDKEGYVTTLDKNGHFYIHKSSIYANWYGHKIEISINFCPRCGKKMVDEQERNDKE